MSDPVYCYPPDFIVLRNKLNVRESDQLDRTEREYAAWRISQGCPKGDFDLDHMRSIHRHIFQDVYDWAGDVRTVGIAKGGTQFMPTRFIETGMQDIHRRIVGDGYLKGLSSDEFAAKAGPLIGDLNHVHPFREGNGRTQMQFLQQLAERAGHRFDPQKIEPDAWIEASISSNAGDYARMTACIRGALESPEKEATQQSAGPKISAESYRKALHQATERTKSFEASKDQELD